MINKNHLLLGLLMISCTLQAQQKDLLKYVNTLTGTYSTYDLSYGSTYPATALPFGMHTWSPQTGKNGEGWKYQYQMNTIRGFQQAHQCSPWVSDYAVFSFMPVTKELVVDENKRATPFSHDNEIAKPNYYRVKLDNNIVTEMAPTERGAHLRFAFPKKEKSFLVLDGYTKQSKIKIIPEERKIIGWVNNQRFAPKEFTNYFVVVFDKPFTAYGTWENKKNTVKAGNATDEGDGIGAYIQFKDGETVQARVASSYISPEQAEVTWQKELGKYKTLEQTKNDAGKIWNKLLNRVLVEGGTDADMQTFYSSLYRTNLFSREFFEYKDDGTPFYWSPYDSKVHDGYMYTDNGFWDTFRGELPWQLLLHPTRHGRYMQALLDAQKQFGWLPAWSFPGETGGMLGNHSLSLLGDAWVKGIRNFDPQQALEACWHEATNKGPLGGANGRAGWKDYWELGYVGYTHNSGSTGQTLEYAYDDFCAYQMAKQSGNTFYQKLFSKSMYNYRNVFDSVTGFMRGRTADGKWLPNFDPVEWGGPYTEGNAWHWTWSVFHDVQGLINMMGGDGNFIKKMDSVFTVPNTVKTGTYGGMIHEMTEMVQANMGQYAHGNQPIQHMIYLYDYARQPWKAQQHAREVMSKLYNGTAKAFPGDEDQGQTSSWYVMSALGFYTVCPGTDQYIIGSPVFQKATITMEDGKKFVIEAANNNASNIYIQSATLNGKPFTRNYFTHSEITSGGILHFEMGPQPNMQRGIGDADKPYSLSNAEPKACD